MMELQTQLFLSTQNSQHDFIDFGRRAIKFQPNVRLFSGPLIWDNLICLNILNYMNVLINLYLIFTLQMWNIIFFNTIKEII